MSADKPRQHGQYAMSEREVKQLLKLLDKLRLVKSPDMTKADDPEVPFDEFNERERQIIILVRQWAKHYGQDVLDLDI